MIGIVGLGRIGSQVLKECRKIRSTVICADQVYTPYEDELKECSTIVCTAPVSAITFWAEFAARNGANFISVTEDHAAAAACKQFYQSTDQKGVCVPQRGLAPGIVNIIASYLISRCTSRVRSVQLRVGALPLSAIDDVYAYTWSEDGVANEYSKPTYIVRNHEVKVVKSVSDVETLFINGVQFEAFNTSGGIGTMHETYGNNLKVKNIDYKSIRYPGTHKVLCDTPNHKFPVLATNDDVVHVVVKVVDDNNKQYSYTTSVYGDETGTAIQKTTAAGVMIWVKLLEYGNNLNLENSIDQEDIWMCGSQAHIHEIINSCLSEAQMNTL